MSIVSRDELAGFFGGDKASEVLFGMIDAAYSSGRPKVVYDIDVSTGALSKALPYLSTYTPTANDRVMIVRGVIIGKIV